MDNYNMTSRVVAAVHTAVLPVVAAVHMETDPVVVVVHMETDPAVAAVHTETDPAVAAVHMTALPMAGVVLWCNCKFDQPVPDYHIFDIYSLSSSSSIVITKNSLNQQESYSHKST